MEIKVSDHIKDAAPGFKGIAVFAKVINEKESLELWDQIRVLEEEMRERCEMSQINKRIEIQSTRQVYKSLGKDPNRYRPSAESLCRRVMKNMPLYRISVLVDLINYISIKYGYSIGGFDGDKISGDLELGVGMSEELFKAIGRGALNIEGLPVYRDRVGPVGTPTSDEERTQLHLDTTSLVMIINGYEGGLRFNDCVAESLYLLRKYAKMKSFDVMRFE